MIGRIAGEKVAEYVAATGDDPDRWTDVAPPSYAGGLLFAVAPRFLADPDVGDATRVLVHTDQRFTWLGPLVVDHPVEVTGTVARVRGRGPISFVTLETTITGARGPLLESTSTFLMGEEAADPDGLDPGEPEIEQRGPVTPAPWPGVVPETGADLPSVEMAASRLDLIRYAAASGDFNPIHLDHHAARGAGLDGIVVHGLLMAAWLSRLAATTSRRPDPVVEMALRFRRALRPAERAVASGAVTDGDGDTARLALALRARVGDLVTATATVRVG